MLDTARVGSRDSSLGPQRGQETLRYCTAFRPAHWVLEPLTPDIKRQGREADHSSQFYA
jgi:hypothetical protein